MLWRATAGVCFFNSYPGLPRIICSHSGVPGTVSAKLVSSDCGSERSDWCVEKNKKQHKLEGKKTNIN